MSDLELLHSIDRCSQLAARHRCTHACHADDTLDKMDRLYAQGTPPAGYWDKLTALAASRGYTMARDSFPRDRGGAGCNGVTVQPGADPWGYIAAGVRPASIHIQEGLTPATEFLVACHELTHMLLDHHQNAESKASQGRSNGGNLEFFDEEVQAHLSAIAVARHAGLAIKQSALCYLSDKVHDFMRAIGQDERYGALLAARQIAAALN